MSQTISVISISGTCHFSHTSNYWHVCWKKTGVTRKRKKEESDIVKLLKNCTKEKR